MAHRTSTRRQLFGSAAAAMATTAAAAVVAAVIGDRPRRGWAATVVQGAAQVDEPAVRLSATTTTAAPPVGRPTRGTLRFPIDPRPDCHVLDNFGDCRSGGSRAHLGVDIIATRGREVYAVRAGVLTGQFDNDPTSASGFGWTLTGDDRVVYRYMHLDAFAPGLDVKARVVEGQLIGFVGSTGNDTFENVHLHFEVRIDGTWVDPLPLLALPAEATVGSPLKACARLVP